MKALAVIAGAALIAGTLALTFRWEAWGGIGGVVFKMDRWTGTITACQVPSDTALRRADGETVTCGR